MLKKLTLKKVYIPIVCGLIVGLTLGLWLPFRMTVNSEGVISIGLVSQEAFAATESQSPDAYVTQTNLDGTITDIQDDPDSPDANWADAVDDSADVIAHVSFGTPSGNPTQGAGVQNFKIWVKRSTSLSTPTVYMDLYEGGVFRANTSLTATNVTSDSGELFTGTWDAVDLSTADGSDVEAYIYGTKAGSAGGSSWVSPTGHVANGWADPTYAYDDETTLYASYVVLGVWSPYLELTIGAINCDSVRMWCSRQNSQVDAQEVDVYYSGAWHNIYSGIPQVDAYYTYTIGSTESVTAMRVRFNSSKSSRWAGVNDADFNEITSATYSSVDVGAVEWNVDYSAVTIDISNAPATWTINGAGGGSGYIKSDTMYWSNPLGDTTTPTVGGATDAECRFTITNNSTVAIDLTVLFPHHAGGDASTNSDTGANGATSFGAKSYFSGQASGAWVIAKNAGSAVGYDGLAALTDIKWGLQYESQSNQWTSPTNMTSTVNIAATAD